MKKTYMETRVAVFGNALTWMDAVNAIRINAITAPTAARRWMEAKDNGYEIDYGTTMIEKKYYKSC